MQFVTGIEETQIIACSKFDTLVHCIIQTFVGFAHQVCNVLSVFFYYIQCTVFRTAVNYNVFHILIRLCDDTLYSIFQYLFGIIGYCNNTELRVLVLYVVV